ncbi:hypothetical protein ACWEOW_11180 [Monashia sp. NPDC004114]
MSQHHKRVGWSGPRVTELRQKWARTISEAVALGDPIKCGCGCGEVIEIGQEFDLGHRVSLAEDITSASVWPEIRGHNRSAGASLGNRLRRQRQQRVRKWL